MTGVFLCRVSEKPLPGSPRGPWLGRVSQDWSRAGETRALHPRPMQVESLGWVGRCQHGAVFLHREGRRGPWPTLRDHRALFPPGCSLPTPAAQQPVTSMLAFAPWGQDVTLDRVTGLYRDSRLMQGALFPSQCGPNVAPRAGSPVLCHSLPGPWRGQVITRYPQGPGFNMSKSRSSTGSHAPTLVNTGPDRLADTHPGPNQRGHLPRRPGLPSGLPSSLHRRGHLLECLSGPQCLPRQATGGKGTLGRVLSWAV